MTLARLSALALAVAVSLACGPLAGVAVAQTTAAPTTTAPTTAAPATAAPATGTQAAGPPSPLTLARQKAAAGLDYEAWGRLASRAEAQIANSSASTTLLEQTRAQVADWRAAFLAAQGGNAARIGTLREQLAALGPVPEAGLAETDELAARRKALTAQMVRLQAPVLAAEEAYSRADGLIGEIDRTLRERQAQALMRLSPMPVNPANWPVAAESLFATVTAIGQELRRNAGDARVRAGLADNLPQILGLLVLAVALIWRGRRWFERWPNRLQAKARTSARGREVWAFLASLGQIVVPTLGVLALSRAITLSGLPGPLGIVLAEALPTVGFAVFAARWLGFQVFPEAEPRPGGLRLTVEQRRAGRLCATLIGLLLALETLRQSIMDPVVTPEAATAVLTFPILVLSGLLLYRLGTLLRQHSAAVAADAEEGRYRDGLIAVLGRAAMGIAAVGPVIAGVGYVTAGSGLVYPAIVSLALVAMLFILQRLVGDIFALFAGQDGAAREGLVPVLVGFALTIASVPLFALIWGARAADITEVFTRLREGFAIGETRISPGNFLTFLAIFGLGYLATRLFQGALRSTILPKTRLDLGGQNAVAAGTGYIGIFLAGLIAINAAGIDLSGLAIVAGALSLGIGFGLQNIVQNFVSGIILLIERPISEGDWIDVGGTQGIVKSISVRSTRIQTFDRTDVIVPNADLVSGPVTNWTRFNLTGRLVVPVGVAYGSDTRAVERVLREIAEAQPLAILNPPPLIVFMGFSVDAMLFEMRIILRDVNFSLTVRSEINHAIVRRFAEEEIDLAQSVGAQAQLAPVADAE